MPAEARIGRYSLLGELGRGGMGVVHLARLEGWGYERLVALKTMQRNLGEEPRARAMFLDEIRIAARIAHPNVVGILEAGETATAVWVAMDLVRGASLRALARVPLDEDWGARWPLVVAHAIADACEGLHAAHELADEQGRPLEIVHRDVSPSNLVVGFDGVTRVLDFGVASAVDRVHRTLTGQFRGKLGYASPEHLDGRPLDRRADVWSIGVVLWEMLTRRALFPARTLVEAAESIDAAPIPTLAEAGAEVAPGLDEIVSKCLQRDRARRFATTRELGDELRLVLAEQLDVLGPGDVAAFMSVAKPRLPALPSGTSPRIVDSSTSPSLASPSLASPSLAASSLAGMKVTTWSSAAMRARVLGALVLGGMLGGALGWWLAAS